MKQFMVGNAHIDIVWFWDWREGYQEIKATFRSALDRMEETPEFIFTCAGAGYYKWVQENDPEMFHEICRRVREGRWVIVGGMWVQPDMNTPGGESLVRHLLYSQRYFQQQFGVTATVGYNVDSFGHNAMMPQLYRKAGIDAYVFMRPDAGENPHIPTGGMVWESPDGSRILAHRIEGTYVSNKDVDKKIDKIFALSETLAQPMMNLYGVGNHGGGPTVSALRKIKAYQAESPRGTDVLFASPLDYFTEIRKQNLSLPLWKGELQRHASGCYSAHSKSKHKHRETEQALLRQEKLGVLSRVLTGHCGKDAFLKQAWENLMLCQFHDSMGGCCTEPVMESVMMKLTEACSVADREENAALQKISWQIDTMKGLPLKRSKDEDWCLWGREGQGTPVVVFNPHEFEAQGIVRINRPIRRIQDDDGVGVPVQTVRAARTNQENDIWDVIFSATVPPMGYRLYWAYFEESTQCFEIPFRASDSHLENEYIAVEFDTKTGAVAQIRDKHSGLCVLCAPSCVRLTDLSHCDTWAHGCNVFDREVGVFTLLDMKLTENGPVRATVRVCLQHENSLITQYYTLHAGSDQVDVRVVADVHEQHRMIKFCFPTVFRNGRDIAEIPYGVAERQATGEESHCHSFCCMEGEEGGLAVLNDGRYSYSAVRGEFCMTVANTSVYADHFGQSLRDDTCRFLDQGELCFCYVLRPYAGSWRDQNLHRRTALLQQPLPHITETYHKGKLSAAYSGLHMDNDKISLCAWKRAEDDNGYVIRFRETSGTSQTLHAELLLLSRTLDLCFSPWEIKTVFLPDDRQTAFSEVLLTEK